MKYHYLVLFFLTVFFSGHSQIDISKTRVEISSFQKLTFPDEYPEDGIFYDYVSPDSTRIYRVNEDKTGSLIDNLMGIAIYAFRYDTLGRQVELVSYDQYGNIKGTDAPPIIISSYPQENLTRTDYYDADYQLQGRIDKKVDAQNREVLFKGYDSNLNVESYQITDYNDSTYTISTKWFDGSDRLKKNRCGVSLTIKKYKTKDYQELVEELYYDEKMEFVDCSHGYYEVPPYSRAEYQFINEKNKTRIQFIDSKNEIVSTIWLNN